MSEKERTISSLVIRLAMTGLVAGVAVGALAAFQEREADAIVATVESLYWILALFLSVQLVSSFIRKLQIWRDLLKADTSETVGLLIGSTIFGTVLAGAIFMIPVVSLATMLRRLGSWEMLSQLYSALAWREFGIVMLFVTATSCILATYLYQKRTV
ncbi:MAG: hypothetical protein IH861_11735 [Chloroflexi bacterium]|nr:hypothetical protein [Chloroflexota bacterium]